MFFDRLRVEEDLERIKKRFKEQYETPPPAESSESIDSVESETAELEAPHSKTIEPVEQSAVKNGDKIGAKDFFAMVIAVFSLLLPFLITMLVVMGLFLLFFFRSSIF